MTTSKTKKDPSIGKTLKDDFHHSDFKKSFKRDFAELKEYFLDDERRDRLRKMGWFKRCFFTTIWLLKSLFFKLTPSRRLLFGVGFILLFIKSGKSNSGNFIMFSTVIFIFILMLELKDKLLAKSELEAGRAVQRALMPEESPEIPGWSVWLYSQPANEVGGDLVDFIKISDSRYAVVLADVAGKGLGAALFTAKLQAILRALAPDFDSVTELCEKINHIFYRDSTQNSFASMVYLELHPDSGTIHLVNAGHLPPLLLRGRNIEELPKGSAALGLLSDETCREQHVDLQPEDLLLVYSDGVTEARNELGEFYEEERLFKFVPALTQDGPEKAGQKLIADVQRFRGEAKAFDDLSIIVLKRTT